MPTQFCFFQIQERKRSQEVLLDRLNQLAAKTASIATVGPALVHAPKTFDSPKLGLLI